MFKKQPKTISGLKKSVSREFLVRHGRVLIADDERPPLIDDLWARGFSVTYVADLTSTNIHLIERPLFDVMLLDFAGVGKTLGEDEGLGLLKHAKQHNPAMVVLTYTSKALSTKHADFFRLADGTLSKDDGVRESVERIEQALQTALSVERLWNSAMAAAGIALGSTQDRALQKQLVSVATDKGNPSKLRNAVLDSIESEGGKAIIGVLIEKVLEVALNAMTSS